MLSPAHEKELEGLGDDEPKRENSTLDDVMRMAFLVFVGLVLGVAVAWYIGFLYQEVRGTGRIVIVPLTVIDSQGKTNDELGKALAQMLNARLQSLSYELQDAQSAFTTDVRASAFPQEAAPAPVGDVRLWTQAVALQTALLQPIDLKLSVGGVDVGGIIPSVQHWLRSDRMLHLTLYAQETDVQVFGSLAALQSSLLVMMMPHNGSNSSIHGVNSGANRDSATSRMRMPRNT